MEAFGAGRRGDDGGIYLNMLERGHTSNKAEDVQRDMIANVTLEVQCSTLFVSLYKA